MAAKKDKPLLPPEETLWQQYSPHFELPLASATSIFLHGLVIGVLAIGGLAVLLAANAEATKPARMEVVMVEDGGSGFEGGSGTPGLPGAPDAGAKLTEFVPPSADQPDQPNPRPTPRPQADEPPELGLPLIDDGSPPISGELFVELQKIFDDAQKEISLEMKIPAPPPIATRPSTKKVGPIGTGNSKGTGGLGGSGSGIGLGGKKGPGSGTGGLGGRKATDQEIKAARWRFDLAGDAKEHARKLAAMGVTVAMPDPAGGFIVITDLNRRPVERKRDALAAYKDAVKWYNTRPESVRSLAGELQLPFTPKYVVLLLPKDREESIAAAETKYALNKGRDPKTVQATWFDFRLTNGAYEPVVQKQE